MEKSVHIESSSYCEKNDSKRKGRICKKLTYYHSDCIDYLFREKRIKQTL